MPRLYEDGTRVEVFFRGEWIPGYVQDYFSSYHSVYTETTGTLAVGDGNLESLRAEAPVRPRKNSFKNWINKLEGKEDDHITTPQETRSGFGEGIGLLHQ